MNLIETSHLRVVYTYEDLNIVCLFLCTGMHNPIIHVKVVDLRLSYFPQKLVVHIIGNLMYLYICSH